MFRFPRIGFLRLMDSIKRMEAWAEQLLLCLATTFAHRFDGIKVGGVDNFSSVLSHEPLTINP